MSQGFWCKRFMESSLGNTASRECNPPRWTHPSEILFNSSPYLFKCFIGWETWSTEFAMHIRGKICASILPLLASLFSISSEPPGVENSLYRTLCFRLSCADYHIQLSILVLSRRPIGYLQLKWEFLSRICIFAGLIRC